MNFNLRNKGQVLIDDDMVDIIGRYQWYLLNCNGRPYAVANVDGKTSYMHRIIMGVTKKKDWIDHINRNTLDNRKENLRICTQAQNLWNGPKKKNNTSGYKGVYWHSAMMMWTAEIMANRKKERLGYYHNPKDAAAAYAEAAKRLHGEFARIS